jgi:uncharacterized membrane protein YphA (DoxX/SURF4 family)
MNPLQSKLVLAARAVLGLGFFVFGLNGFLHFLPQPPMSGPPAEFFGALFATGYMLPLIKGTEVVTGLLLLSGRYVPLALTVLAPVMVNILAFHAFLAPAGLLVPIVFAALGIYLAYAHRSVFAPLLRARAPLSQLPSERPARLGGSALST